MSYPVALGTLRSRLRRVADLGGDATTGRYPNADCDRELNQSHQRVREIASSNGHKLYLKQSAPLTMTVGPLANTAFGTVPLPTDCVSVYGIDVVLSATEVRPLFAMDWDQRCEFVDVYGNLSGPPQGFHIYNTGVESTNTVAAGSIAIFPAPDRAYTYTTWYLPKWTPIATGSDTFVFDMYAGWDDFHIWDAAIKFMAGDNDRLNAYQIAVQERAKAEELIRKRSTTIQRVGTGGIRNVRAEMREARARGFYRVP